MIDSTGTVERPRDTGEQMQGDLSNDGQSAASIPQAAEAGSRYAPYFNRGSRNG